MEKKKENNTNNNVSIATVVSVFLIFAIAMVFVIFYLDNRVYDTNNYFSNYNKINNNELKELIDKQVIVDKKIEEILEDGEYTFEKPCVLKDPYGISPLSALILFNTKEETEIELYINDTKVTKVEASKKHLIPVYGLYTNATNTIELKNSNGDVSEVSIVTDNYNSYIGEFQVKKNLNGYSHLFLTGDLNNKDSYLRGFDYNGNMIFYMNFGHIKGSAFYSDRLYISYNSEYNEALRNLKLEIDYLGRIYSISKEDEDIIEKPNLTIDEGKYVVKNVNLYKESISNYELKEFIDNNKNDLPIKIYTSTISNELSEAKVYDEDYSLALNGSYITYDFKGKDVRLLFVEKNSSYTYAYDIDETGMLKVGFNIDTSVYAIIDGKYYTLLTILNF